MKSMTVKVKISQVPCAAKRKEKYKVTRKL